VRRERITAVFRPRRNDIAIMAMNGVEIASSAMTVKQARELHASLSQALRMADCRDDPLKAVDGCHAN
jgi:hypothetical protein